MGFKRLVPFVIFILVLVLVFPATPAYSRGNKTPKPTPTATSTATPTPTATPVLLSTCATSTPPSGTYTVTLCFTTPSSGSVVTGEVQVDVSASVSGTSPGIIRMVFYINGSDLLMDYQSPYSFILPSTKWQDGTYYIAVEAVMRDGYTTANQASISLIFNNGNFQPPVNNNTFTPSSGTTPQDGSPFVVAAAGDGADGATSAANVTAEIATINPNLFLYLGDVYQNGTIAEFYNWYGNGGTNFNNFYSITNPTIGNHEYTGNSAVGYFDYWNNIPDYYSYNADGWHFISLNSNSSRIGVTINSAQYAWLEQDLAANSNMCTIVYYHHPLFNIGAEGPTTSMSDIWSLMAQYGVSIVLNGHDHDYQRWVPLDGNGNPSPTGITEFVAGGGGHGLQTFIGSDYRVAFSDDLNPEAFGVLKMVLNPGGVNFEYINSSGLTLDSGVVSCAKAGTDSQAPSSPTNLTTNAVGATQVDLTWQASSDNVGVSGYDVYRDGNLVATVSGATLSYSDYSVLPSSTYSYSIDAYDPSSNTSGLSTPNSVTTSAMPPTLTFEVGADTYVNSGSPTGSYGSATVLRADGSPDLHSYLRFTVQGLAGYPILHAYLLIYANSSSSLGIDTEAVADNSWIENAVTYNTAPPLGAVLNSSGPFTGGSWVTLDVSSYITGEGTYSFGITTPGSSTISFASKESGANQAELVLNLLIPDSEAPSTPTGVIANAASSTEVDLSWLASTDNVGVTGYDIYRDNTLLATFSGGTLSYIDNTVLENTTYAYTVDAFDAAGNYSPQSSPVSVTTPSMSSSLSFSVSADTYVNSGSPTSNYGSATVWRVDGSPDIHAYLQFTVQGLGGYQVQQAYLQIFANTSSNIGIDVQAVADNIWNENTLTYNTAPPLGAQLASSGVFASATWVTMDVTPYITGEGTYSFGITTPGSSTLSFAAKESGVNGAQLVVVLSLSDAEVPSVPAGISASASSATQVDLAWQASSDNVGVTGYTIYRDNTLLTTVPGTSLSYSDNTLSPSTTYNYSVDAFDAAGNHSAASSPVSVTTPAMPSSLSFSVGADTYVNSGSPTSNYGSLTVWRVDGSPDLHAYLRFNVHGLAGYPIQNAYLMVYANTSSSMGIDAISVADNNWDENTVTYDTAPPLGNLLGSSTTLTSGSWVTIDVTPYITGEGIYSFGITTPGSSTLSFAAKEAGTNGALLVIDLAIQDTQAPSVPSGLTANASSATQVDLAWQLSSDNVGIAGYTIYRDNALLTTVSGGTLSYSDSSAYPSTTYSYSVDAFDDAGNHSAVSSPVSVTTPAMPSSLNFIVGADTYVDSSTPTANFGSTTVWRVDGSPDQHAYLRFTVQGLAGYPIQSAYLMVYANTSSNIGIDALSVADNTWDENTVTYDTAPPLGNLIGSSTTFAAGSWVAIDVTPYVTSEGTYSYGIITPGATNLSFDSKEGVNEAQLVINLAFQDAQAPSVPTGLTASAVNATQVDLSWQASTDNVGVAGYTIYRDNAVLATVPGDTVSYSDNTVLESTTYNYSIDAFDVAGNHSLPSSPVSVTTPAMPSSLTFTVEADTYVNSGSPTSNYGSVNVWRVDGSPDVHAYLRFTVQGLEGYPILHAYLQVYAGTKSNIGINAMSVANNNWVENTVTYNNAPTLGALLGSSGSFTAGSWITFDVTPYITGEGTYSIGITTPGSSTLKFASKESGKNEAQLIIVLK
jgi:chitodextrinase